MAVRFESSQVIDRPLDRVFHFFAVEHVRNHPRWDSDIELWLDNDAPLGVGTIIHRRNKRGGKAVEGTMKVLEFEVDRVLSMEIWDGPAVMYGRTTFEALNEGQTRLTIVIDIPWMNENADRSFLNSRLEDAARIRKQLMESEI
ncbi:MAG: SRPBCC family protein [Armatimonadota bacterium]|nr:SRPBCC family protein [Armatimonadota bacterium]